MAVAEAWCVTTEEAKMAIGVPTTPQPEGILAFNAHRIYGTLNYPYLMTNWKYDWAAEDYTLTPADGASYQPLYVFKKVTSL